MQPASLVIFEITTARASCRVALSDLDEPPLAAFRASIRAPESRSTPSVEPDGCLAAARPDQEPTLGRCVEVRTAPTPGNQASVR
jgi:hypothetical protein